MLSKRTDQDEESVSRSEVLEMETARSSAESSSGEKPVDKKKDEEHMSLFWRVFGGTILSIVALVVITLYNNITTSISDLRTDLSHEREARADLVKKDDFNARANAQSDRIRAIDGVKIEFEGLKEKLQAQTAAVDAIKKDVAENEDGVKKEGTALGVLKERVSELESVKKDFAGLDVIKEKLTNTAADLKSIHDEMTKLAGALEQNKLADLERKTSRDSQYKQVDEALKELQKGLQDCREKLARLEGTKPAPSGSIAKPSSSGGLQPAGGAGTPPPSPMPPE
jgi:predicted nuclease with TOPRIM domain